MPPASTGKKSKGASGSGIAKKRRGGPKAPEFSDYLTKIRKEIAPDLGCSTQTMHLLNGLVANLAQRLINKTGTLARYDKKETMKSKHASTAANMILIGPLSSHAWDYADKAVAAFQKTAKA